jgi:DNA-binding NtrC family response regulator
LPHVQHPEVLLVAIDDDPTSLDLIAATVEQEGLEVLTATDPQRGLDLVLQRRPPIVICDLMMPGMTGMEILSEIVRVDPVIDVLLLTAYYSTESAVEAIQKGASDYLTKPLDTRKLRSRVDELIENVRRRRCVPRLDAELLQTYQFRGMVGRSPRMLEVFARIQRIAPHYRTVLLTGPTGSGKELVARAVHESSPVSSGPFVVCNMGAIPDHLVESELFGHVKGSFTGATQDKAGLFEMAHGGTILLDEIGEMPLSAQAKLLRVVQHSEVQRVGATRPRKIDVRIIAATHRDLRTMVAEKTFREDLFFRLGMLEIRLPSLAERKEDLPLLTRHFVRHFSQLYNRSFQGLTRKAEAALAAYDWPGNVRELEGTIGSAALLGDPPTIDLPDLPLTLTQPHPTTAHQNGSAELLLTLEEMEVVHAHRVLKHFDGDKLRTAETLGISRATLYRLLSKTPSISLD